MLGLAHTVQMGEGRKFSHQVKLLGVVNESNKSVSLKKEMEDFM